MEPWHREIVELHEFFEAYFRGAAQVDELGRLEAALGTEFTIVDPSGAEASRREVIDSVRRGHGHAPDLRITITDARLLWDEGRAVAVRYVERHRAPAVASDRLSTVVFERPSDSSATGSAPNGLRWRTLHETWLADG